MIQLSHDTVKKALHETLRDMGYIDINEYDSDEKAVDPLIVMANTNDGCTVDSVVIFLTKNLNKQLALP